MAFLDGCFPKVPCPFFSLPLCLLKIHSHKSTSTFFTPSLPMPWSGVQASTVHFAQGQIHFENLMGRSQLMYPTHLDIRYLDQMSGLSLQSLDRSTLKSVWLHLEYQPRINTSCQIFISVHWL